MTDQQPDFEANWTALEEAVKRFNAENLGSEGALTGFVLFVTSSRYDEDGDVVWKYNYAVSRSMDMIRAFGLVGLASRRMRREAR